MTPDDLARRLASDPTGDPPFALGALTTRLLDDDGRVSPLRTRPSGRPEMPLVVVAVVVIAVAAILRAAPRDDSVVAALPDDIRGRGQFTIAVSSQSPQLQTAGGVDGFDVDVANEVAHRLGIRVRIVAAAPTSIVSGRWPEDWDLAFAATAAPDDVAPALESGRRIAWQPGAVIVRGSDASRQLSTLAGSAVCAVQGGIANAWLDGRLDASASPGTAAPVGVDIHLAPSFDDCLLSLRSGTVEAAVVDFAYDQLQPGPDLAVLPDRPFAASVVPLVARAGPGRRELLALVDSTLEAMRSDGTLSRLSLRRFGGLDLTNPP